jgi:hypothetical protein
MAREADRVKLDVLLSPDLPLDDELLRRERAVRALDVVTALEEGFARFVAAESFDVGPDDRVIAGVTRVAWDHWLIKDFPGRFIPAMSNPGQKPLHDEGDVMGRRISDEPAEMWECVMSFCAAGDGPGDLAVSEGSLLRGDDAAVQSYPSYFVPHPATANEIRRAQNRLLAEAGALRTA